MTMDNVYDCQKPDCDGQVMVTMTTPSGDEYDEGECDKCGALYNVDQDVGYVLIREEYR